MTVIRRNSPSMVSGLGISCFRVFVILSGLLMVSGSLPPVAVCRGEVVGESDSSATAETEPPAECDPCCDPAKQKALATAIATAHKDPFYLNKFDYLCDECYDGYLLGDELKRRCPTDWMTYDIGGQYRLRQHSERNHRGLHLTGRDDDFLLHRTRLYGNFEFGGWARVYVEMLNAVSELETFAPRRIEENRTDLQNAFGDLKLWDICCGELWARYGRQELLYGNQRTVTSFDWANTRRAFEGAKVFWKGEAWDIDAFWTRPILPNAVVFDSPDQSQEFSGVYSVYKGIEGQTWDLYYLRYVGFDEAPSANFDYNTFGARWNGKRDAWLWELEAAYQFGEVGAADQSAGAYTLGVGRELASVVWQPTVWVYYDWASGDDALGTGYHHLFPLSHRYLGFMDLFGRRNIEDLNVLVTASPAEKWKLLLWYHILSRQNPLDVPYTVTMAPAVALPGGSGELGQELDLLATWNFHPRMNLALGYSHFFTGAFYSTNPSPGLFNGDADFYYTQLTVNF